MPSSSTSSSPAQSTLEAAARRSDTWFTLTLICVGVACLFASQNLMSPNLTSIAEEFQFDKDTRDRLLGARLSLAFSVFSIPGAMVLGLLADRLHRRNLFVWVVGLGAIGTLCTAYVEDYDSLFWLRILSGFLGDLYPPDNRSLPSTLVTAAMGVGILVGQIIAGVLGPHMGWRAPFVVVSLPGLACSLLIWAYIEEPLRGQSENAVAELLKSGGQYQMKTLGWQSFIDMMKIKTNIILISQALPGTIPWGVLFAYLNDFLSQEKGLPVEQATLVVSLFGIGSAVGGIGGGLIGQWAYRKSKRLLPVVMGVSTILGTFPMYVLINAKYNTTTYVLFVIVPCTFLAGILANINGTNVRPLLLNVNLPETRGSAVSVANLVANLGKGIGPSIANALMTRLGGREGAFNATMSLWFLNGGMVFLLVFFLLEDEAHVQWRDGFLLVFTLLEDEAHVEEELRRATSKSRNGGLPRGSATSNGKRRDSGDTEDNDEEEGLLMMARNGTNRNSNKSDSLYTTSTTTAVYPPSSFSSSLLSSFYPSSSPRPHSARDHDVHFRGHHTAIGEGGRGSPPTKSGVTLV